MISNQESKFLIEDIKVMNYKNKNTLFAWRTFCKRKNRK